MKSLLSFKWIGVLLLCASSVWGQQISPPENNTLSRTTIENSGTTSGAPAPVNQTVAADTLPVFTAEEFYQAVLQHHPIVKLAVLLSQEAQAKVMQARGAFDPKLLSDYASKNFGNTLYYEKWRSGVSVPVMPGGLDLKMYYDRNIGKYLNPENNVPATGLMAIGVNVPITQGLLIDSRRNALRQAQLAVNMAEAKQLDLINKTLLDAAKAYWDWYQAHQQFRWIEQGYQLAQTRFLAIRERNLIGDAAAIDTTEALITVQDREVQLQQTNVLLQNARLLLGTYLWSSQPGSMPQPIDLPETIVPQTVPLGQANQLQLQALLERAAQQHPELIRLANQQQQLTLEERYRRSLLLPKVNLEASLLSRGPLPTASADGLNYYGFQTGNHKIGVDVAFPIFLRSERGKLRQTQLQNQQTVLERQQAGRDIINDVQRAWNELVALEQQIATQQQTTANQQILVRAEVEKFQLGESSLFLVNSRESKLIDLQVKLEELRSKQQKALANLWYSAGSNVGTR